MTMQFRFGGLKMKRRQNGQIMTKVFKRLLCVQIFAVLTAMLGSIVDGIIIISNFLGRASMAAFSISMPVFIVLACISNMLGNGAQTICGKALGRNEGDHINGVFTLTILLVCVLGVVSSGTLQSIENAILTAWMGEKKAPEKDNTEKKPDQLKPQGSKSVFCPLSFTQQGIYAECIWQIYPKFAHLPKPKSVYIWSVLMNRNP